MTRIEHGSNIAGLTVPVPGPEEYVERLRTKAITVGGARRSEKSGSTDVLLVANETIMRRPAEEIASQFIEAIRPA